jgi:hypothetical protein
MGGGADIIAAFIAFAEFAALIAIAAFAFAALLALIAVEGDLLRFGQRQSPRQSSPASAEQDNSSVRPSAPGLHLQLLLQCLTILLSSLDVGGDTP